MIDEEQSKKRERERKEPSKVEIVEVKRDEAELLFSIIHQEGLIHDIDGSIRNQLLQVISVSFSSEILLMA